MAGALAWIGARGNADCFAWYAKGVVTLETLQADASGTLRRLLPEDKEHEALEVL